MGRDGVGIRRGQRACMLDAGLAAADAEAIAAHFAKHLGRPVRPVTRRNDALLAGFRVRVGDDVTDVSAASRLAALAKSLS